MTHGELEDAIPLYAIGALERSERQVLDAHLLSGCPSCHSALREFQTVAAALPFGLDIVAPPRLLKASIMAARASTAGHDTMGHTSDLPRLGPGKWMEHVSQPDSRSTIAWMNGVPRWIVGSAVAAAVAGSVAMAWIARDSHVTDDSVALTQWKAQAASAAAQSAELQRRLEEREQSLVRAREELQRSLADMADLKDQLIQREAELDVLKTRLDLYEKRRARAPEDELAVLLRTPTIKAAVLAGTEAAGDASGIFLYDHRARKAWLYTLNLPACPAGTEYRLWLMNEQPVSVGAFRVGKGETSHLFVQSVPDFPGAKAFSVSLEPAGGGRQPAGVPYLRSSL
ncbi:MAG: anti-sigma factor [Nitrospira sp.]|nr:anti-sigma factor [Nitrospira sp.]MCP9462206.1 anti-sigma factor [Nitrospira sp.]MCP9474938.1 anti-sigma factor [Nitrospira sp.]